MLSGAMSRCRKSPSCTISSASSSGVTIRSSSGWRGARFRPFSQALKLPALLEVEHHVAGVVGAEVAVDAHDVGMNEAGERLRLLDEALEPPLVVLGAVLRARRGMAGGAAGGEVGGKVFLDGDEPRQRQLVGEIGDAEAAGTQHALDAVVANQLRPVRQRQQVGVGRRVGLLHCHSHHGPTDNEHAGSIPRKTVVASFAPSARPQLRTSPPNGTEGECGQYCGGRMGLAWRMAALLQRLQRAGHVPAVMLRQGFAQRVGNAASNNPGRAARDRPVGQRVGRRRALLAAASAAGAAGSVRLPTSCRPRRHLERLAHSLRRIATQAGELLGAGLPAGAGAGDRPVAPCSSCRRQRSSPSAVQAAARRKTKRAASRAAQLRAGAAEVPSEESAERRCIPCGRTRPGSRCKTAPPERCRSPARRSASAGTRTTTSACPIRPSTAITR